MAKKTLLLIDINTLREKNGMDRVLWDDYKDMNAKQKAKLTKGLK